MRKKPLKILLYLLSILLWGGCSVKEDRNLCPCRLILDFSEVDTSVVKSANVILTADNGFSFASKINAEDFQMLETIDVPRSDVNLMIWGEAEGLLNEGTITIPLGKDCPPLYNHLTIIDARRESFREIVSFKKNHCRMTIDFRIGDILLEDASLFGNVNGYTYDGKPILGEFRCGLRKDSGKSVVNIPRQIDNSLVMTIQDNSNVLKHLALGEYIVASGYDWQAQELADVHVQVDLFTSNVLISIQNWGESHAFEITI